MATLKIPVYKDLAHGNTTLVGHVELDSKHLPEDPFFSITFVQRKTGPFRATPHVATLIDDFDLYLGLALTMSKGTEFLAKLTNKGDLV